MIEILFFRESIINTWPFTSSTQSSLTKFDRNVSSLDKPRMELSRATKGSNI